MHYAVLTMESVVTIQSYIIDYIPYAAFFVHFFLPCKPVSVTLRSLLLKV